LRKKLTSNIASEVSIDGEVEPLENVTDESS